MNAHALADSTVAEPAAVPVQPSRTALRPLGAGHVRITGGFWAERQQVNGSVSLDHCLSWLDRQGSIDNLRSAALDDAAAGRRGRAFSDSHVYTTMEALAWEVGRTGDAAHRERLAALTSVVAAALRPDGYLDSAFGRPGQPSRYGDLEGGHELYCAGHLIQAGVAEARNGGSGELLDVARRVADHVCDTFGAAGIEGVCGHPGIEMALVELARVTDDSGYLGQAALFVQRRGEGTLADGEFGPTYFQDDLSVRRREVLDGHAVRALYLAAGAVDVAMETEDDELLAAVVRQWEATVARRTYLTGGMGAHHRDGAFGDDFVLPPDCAYAETCAGIASVMLSWRLLLATGEARYADLIERTLYNVVAASAAADGRSFLSANPLHRRHRGTPADPDSASPRAATSMRAPWFDVPCCPTNVARLLASLAAYFVTTDARGVQVHQYADAEIDATLDDGREVGLTIATGYPKHGTVTITVTKAPWRLWTLSLRVPAWAGDAATIVVPGGGRRKVAAGTAEVTRVFTAGDEIRLELPVSGRWVAPDPRIDAVRGCLAVERGPLVMCVESTDLPGRHEVDSVVVDPGADPDDQFGSVHVDGQIVDHADRAWPYGRLGDAAAARTASALTKIPLTPYYSWGNRGPSTMRVWLPTV